MWHGGGVWGCSTCPQQAVGGQLRQGSITMINGSEISYANDAVSLWNGASGSVSTTGGIVSATNSRFRNNSRSVKFIRYENFVTAGGANHPIANRSRFINCDFTVGQYLIPYPFRLFISGWEVKGVGINGCRFKNLHVTNGAQTVKGQGIVGHDFGFSVGCASTSSAPPPVGSDPCDIPSEFHNLYQAVTDHTVARASSVTVHKAVFVNNYEGVTLRGVAAPRITGNTMTILEPPTNPPPFTNLYPNTTGIFIETGSGYAIAGNAMTGLGKGKTTGTMIWGTGSDNNKVERNTYNNLNTGGLSNFINRNANDPNAGLQFLCNSYTSANYNEAARGNNPANDGMRENQGSLILPAGNQFNGGSLIRNIRNLPTEVAPVKYYYGTGATSFPPSNTPGVTTIATAKPDNCTPPGSGGPYPPKGFKMRGNEDPRSIPVPLYAYLHDDDSTAGRDSFYYWAGQWQSPYGDLLVTDLLIEDNRLDEVDAVYDNIVSNYELDGPEAEEFSNWGRQLIALQKVLTAAGKHRRDLTSTQVATLEAIAEGGSMWAKVRAQGWLSLYDGRVFQNETLFPDEDTGGLYRIAGNRGAAEGDDNTPYSVQDNNAVYPNPAAKELNVRYTPAEGAHATIQVYDLLGRTVLKAELRVGKTTLDITKFQTGNYLWRILENGHETERGKFVKE